LYGTVCYGENVRGNRRESGKAGKWEGDEEVATQALKMFCRRFPAAAFNGVLLVVLSVH